MHALQKRQRTVVRRAAQSICPNVYPLCADKETFARELVPFTGPGSKLVIQRGRTKKTPWTLGFDPPLPSLDPKKLDGKGLSYSIAFADLHETAVIRTASFAKVKKVSLYRQQSYYGRMEFGFTTLLTTGSPPACIL